MRCFHASDLHGRVGRYSALLQLVAEERPELLLLGGDLLLIKIDVSWAGEAGRDDFLADFLLPAFRDLAARLGDDRPRILVILGNDDPRIHEASLREAEEEGLLHYLHGRRLRIGDWDFYGYACVPPTPFLLKDWERYDVSRYVDPGCVSPEEGRRTVAIGEGELRYGTIAKDLKMLAKDAPQDRAVYLFHSPPYKTLLDRAALEGQTVDHVPRDPHIGSIAIARFLEARQPALALHGHVHESTRLTGSWRDRIGRTHCLQAAHDGPELSLIRFDLEDPAAASRELVAV